MDIQNAAREAREAAEAAQQEASNARTALISQRYAHLEVKDAIPWIRVDVEDARCDVLDTRYLLNVRESVVNSFEEGTESWNIAENLRAEEARRLRNFRKILREKKKELKEKFAELHREAARRRECYSTYRQKKVLADQKESEARVLEGQAAQQDLLLAEQQENGDQVAPNQEGQAAQEDLPLAEQPGNEDQVVPDQSLEDQAAQIESA